MGKVISNTFGKNHYHPCLNHVTHITACLSHMTSITVSLKEMTASCYIAKNDVSNRYLSSLSTTPISTLWRVLWTEESLVAAVDGLAWLPCGVYSEFVQQRIQDTSMALFTAVHSTVGRVLLRV